MYDSKIHFQKLMLTLFKCTSIILATARGAIAITKVVLHQAMKAVNVCLSLSPGLSLHQNRGLNDFNECFPCVTLLNREK